MPVNSDVTILIAARNAATTIGRAIRSVTSQGPYPILLVDDYSTDDTVSFARRAAGQALTVISPPRHETLGLTRQAGLATVTTRYTMLLDADDELLPGRIQRMLNALTTTGYEIFTDAIVLHDGITGRYIKDMPVPDYLTKTPAPVRLFERNYLPGIGQLGFVTALAQRIGYDTSLHGAEDIDLVLRMVLAGYRFSYEKSAGYRMYAYPDSLSRNLDNQRAMYGRCLKKFSYEATRALYLEHNENDRTALWALVSMALFRKEYANALGFIDEIAAMERVAPHIILEPEGPQPLPEAWRLAFHRGTILLLLGRAEEAIVSLERARVLKDSPEVLNNLAIAWSRLHNSATADALLREALLQYPTYLDAQLNQETPVPERITTHPLRLQATRDEYRATTLP